MPASKAGVHRRRGASSSTVCRRCRNSREAPARLGAGFALRWCWAFASRPRFLALPAAGKSPPEDTSSPSTSPTEPNPSAGPGTWLARPPSRNLDEILRHDSSIPRAFARPDDFSSKGVVRSTGPELRGQPRTVLCAEPSFVPESPFPRAQQAGSFDRIDASACSFGLAAIAGPSSSLDTTRAARDVVTDAPPNDSFGSRSAFRAVDQSEPSTGPCTDLHDAASNELRVRLHNSGIA
jgi:hypothetical protein